MRHVLLTISLLAVAVGWIFLPSISYTDDWNRATTAIFNQPVQIPGKVLPPGIYVFKLVEFAGERNVIQVWNADQTELVATIMGWPNYLREAPPESRFILEDQDKGEPAVLKAWFYRGNSNIETFVYAKRNRK